MRTTTEVTRNITQSLFIQYSWCATASLIALSYKDNQSSQIIIMSFLFLPVCALKRFLSVKSWIQLCWIKSAVERSRKFISQPCSTFTKKSFWVLLLYFFHQAFLLFFFSLQFFYERDSCSSFFPRDLSQKMNSFESTCSTMLRTSGPYHKPTTNPSRNFRQHHQILSLLNIR